MYDWYICFIYIYTLHLMLLFKYLKSYKYLYASSSYFFKINNGMR